MATKKDLVEAYSFSRRRLVTAFVSGAPGGREVEPSRPGRTIVGGIALAVLLMAGAAIGGVFKPQVKIDWDEPAFIIAKDEGVNFVIVEKSDSSGEPQLRPILNVTSAKLILGSDLEEKTKTVPLKEINDNTETGPTIGILGAPATVPETSQLIQDGWSACTGDDLGIQVDLAAEPDATPSISTGFVVQSIPTSARAGKGPGKSAEPVPWLIATTTDNGAVTRAYRYRLPAKGGDTITTNLGLDSPDDAPVVPPDWLALFSEGGSLDPAGFQLSGVGKAPDPALRQALGAQARVGDFFRVGEDVYLITQDKALKLSPFAAKVFGSIQFKGFKPKQLSTDGAGVRSTDSSFQDRTHWPLGALTKAQTGEVCATMLGSPDGVPVIGMAQQPSEAASAAGINPGEVETRVDPGAGAFVQVGDILSSFDQTETYLVDDRGISYPLGPEADSYLGYGDEDGTRLPDAWNQLFDEGVLLSRDAALCPPREQDEQIVPGRGKSCD